MHTFGGESLYQQDWQLWVTDELFHQIHGRFVLEGRDEPRGGIFHIFQQDRNDPAKVICEGRGLHEGLGRFLPRGISIAAVSHLPWLKIFSAAIYSLFHTIIRYGKTIVFLSMLMNIPVCRPLPDKWRRFIRVLLSFRDLDIEVRCTF